MQHIDWFEKCDWTKYLISIPKRNYQSNNTCKVTFVLIFSFHRVIIVFTFSPLLDLNEFSASKSHYWKQSN